MFIKLTGYANDKPIFIKPEVITVIAEQTAGYTHVQISNIEGGVGVKETPEQIVEMIKNETKELSGS